MRLFIIIVFLQISVLSFSQTVKEINQFKNLFQVEEIKNDYSIIKQNNTNELQMLSSVFFVLYKEFISSQDVASCVFYPSCSVYTIQTIRINGFIIGILDSFDRLSRCNPFNSEKYPHYKNTTLQYDPVK